MDDELKQRLDAQDEVLQAMFTSVEKTRKYFLWTLIGSIVMVVIPIVALIVIVPMVLDMYSTAFSGLL